MATSADEDYYALLEIKPTASAAEIGKAYRRKAFKCHPDKVGPEDTAAAALFLQLSKAVEVLTDESKRKTYDALFHARQQQQARLRDMDAQRCKQKEDLVARETAATLSRQPSASATESVQRTIERLREQGARGREAYEQQRRQAAAVSVTLAKQVEDARRAVESVDMHDCILKFKWKKESTITDQDLVKIVSEFATVDRILLFKSDKRSASVLFKDLYGAFAVMEAKTRSDAPSLQDFKISWAAGDAPKAASLVPIALIGQTLPSQSTKSQPEPAAIPLQFVPTPSQRQHTASGFPLANPSANASMDNYEELTLKRMRQRAQTSTNSSQSIQQPSTPTHLETESNPNSLKSNSQTEQDSVEMENKLKRPRTDDKRELSPK